MTRGGIVSGLLARIRHGAAIMVGVVMLASPQAVGAASTAVTAAQLAAVEGPARLIAAECDEPSVSMEVAKGTWGASLAVTEPELTPPTIIDPRTGLPWTESPVYVASMRGHFVDSNAPVPAGSPAPSGTVLTVTVDAMSGSVVGIVLTSGQAPDLQSLGSVTDVGVS
jgi:hypothetical protein